MRLLMLRQGPRLPREDCEWMGLAIQRYGRRPRANRRIHLRDDLAGAVWLAILGCALAVLVCVW